MSLPEQEELTVFNIVHMLHKVLRNEKETHGATRDRAQYKNGWEMCSDVRRERGREGEVENINGECGGGGADSGKLERVNSSASNAARSTRSLLAKG